MISDKYLYLIINLGSIIIPFVFSFHPKLKFYLQWKSFIPALTISTIVFCLWDHYFTQLEVWGFNHSFITGMKLWNLPIEEVLFFICIPYASIFTYHCFNKLIQRNYLQNYSKQISVALSIFSVAVALANTDKLYTVTTFFPLAILLWYAREKYWLGRFIFMYIFILIPFFIVNGILTGSFLEKTIVWYNNKENLSLRVLTIPIEDVFYGMLLLLLNTTLYEYFAQRIDHSTE